ncbi:MAG: threonine/serine exporter family protein [Bacillota bacterium]|nr:threonine/serine exporter family protein [Bacillota bacterium]
MDVKQLCEVALKAGEILLVSGAEIYRVEDTVTRICRSYNVEADCFVMPTGIFITVFGSNREPISVVRRVKARTVDLSRIEKVNSFSRSLIINPVTYEEAVKTLNGIRRTKRYHFLLRLFAAGITAFSFTILFKGNERDALAAFLISMFIYFVNEKISQTGMFYFFEFFISGVIAGMGSLLAVRLFPGLNLYRIIIGAIMILVPGVAITNAIKDALNGDIASSTFRMAEAIFIAAAVGAGVSIALYVGFNNL